MSVRLSAGRCENVHVDRMTEGVGLVVLECALVSETQFFGDAAAADIVNCAPQRNSPGTKVAECHLSQKSSGLGCDSFALG
jgi:hypothetical protein